MWIWISGLDPSRSSSLTRDPLIASSAPAFASAFAIQFLSVVHGWLCKTMFEGDGVDLWPLGPSVS